MIPLNPFVCMVWLCSLGRTGSVETLRQVSLWRAYEREEENNSEVMLIIGIMVNNMWSVKGLKKWRQMSYIYAKNTQEKWDSVLKEDMKNMNRTKIVSSCTNIVHADTGDHICCLHAFKVWSSMYSSCKGNISVLVEMLVEFRSSEALNIWKW